MWLTTSPAMTMSVMNSIWSGSTRSYSFWPFLRSLEPTAMDAFLIWSASQFSCSFHGVASSSSSTSLHKDGRESLSAEMVNGVWDLDLVNALAEAGPPPHFHSVASSSYHPPFMRRELNPSAKGTCGAGPWTKINTQTSMPVGLHCCPEGAF